MKKFETFVNDDTRDSASMDLLPKHNPVVNLEAKKFVERLADKNNISRLLQLAGIDSKHPLRNNFEKESDMLSDDKAFQEIKQKAIDFCVENPQEINKGEDEISTPSAPTKKGDGIPRVSPNLGGTSHANSPRIGESKAHFDKEIEISSDEMSYFDYEQPLIDLVSDRKIQLLNNIIKYNNRDKETKQVLDIYFELDEVDPIEETLEYLTHSDTKPSSIIYLGEIGLQLDLTGLQNIESLIEIKNQYNEAFLFDMIDEKTEQNLVRKSQSIFQNWGIRTSKNIGEISESTSELLGIANGRFEILTLDMINQDYKVVIDIAKSVSDYILVSFSKIEKINRGKTGDISQFTSMVIEEFSKNATYICDIQHDYEGWKELLSNLFEKL